MPEHIHDIRGGVCHGPGPCNTTPIGLGKNWVTKVGGLPLYIRAIAQALIRSGHSESQAIQLAVGIVKRWAAGAGKVTADTRSRAAAAVAEWEAKKGAAHGRSDEDDLDFRQGGPTSAAQVKPPKASVSKPGSSKSDGKSQTHSVTKGDAKNGKAGKSDAKTGQQGGGKGGKGDHAKGHPFYGNQHKKLAGKQQQQNPTLDVSGNEAKVSANDIGQTKGLATGTSGGGGKPPPAPAGGSGGGSSSGGAAGGGGSGGASSTQTTAQKATAHAAAVQVASNSPVTKGSIAKAAIINGLPPDERAVYETAVPPAGFVWQDGSLVQRSNEDALAFRALMESGTSGLLLPVGQPKAPKPREVQTIGPPAEHHKFKGHDLTSCSQCGQPLTANIHRARTGEGKRHAGPDHEHVASGHIHGDKGKHVTAARSQYDGDLAQVEPGIESTMKGMFAKQRTSTIARLTGKRGKTMLKRASQPPVPPEDGAEGIAATPEGNAAAVDPSAVFDTAFWTQELANALQPHMAAVTSVATSRVKHQVGAPSDLQDHDSLAKVGQALAQRAQNSAMDITSTTRDQITSALQAGVADGESMDQLTARVNAIFDNADKVRARMIAQTEAVGAMNTAANAYANALPEGIVGSKVWLAHHDSRTRPTHRIADGQNVPINAKFLVGNFPMDHPGDPTAPPGEVINCRCGTAFLPPNMTLGTISSAKTLQGLVPQSTINALQKVQAGREAKYGKVPVA